MDKLGYKQLAQLVITSTSFNKEHRQEIKDIVFSLDLDNIEGIGDVNEKIKGQMDMEATMVFLLGFYRQRQMEMVGDLEREEGLALLDVPTKDAEGYKTGAKSAKAQVVTAQDVASLKLNLTPLKSLYEDLENLFNILLRRNRKLEELSINYRREKAIDDRT